MAEKNASMAEENSSMAEKKILMKSSDGELFEVDYGVSVQFKGIKDQLKEGHPDRIITLETVDSNIFAKVIEYGKMNISSCSKGKAVNVNAIDKLKNWDTNFVEVDHDTLNSLIQAADDLKMDNLLKLVCGKVAKNLIGKTPDEIAKMFNLKNDERKRFAKKGKRMICKNYSCM